jgi:hypothetical protein
MSACPTVLALDEAAGALQCASPDVLVGLDLEPATERLLARLAEEHQPVALLVGRDTPERVCDELERALAQRAQVVRDPGDEDACWSKCVHALGGRGRPTLVAADRVARGRAAARGARVHAHAALYLAELEHGYEHVVLARLSGSRAALERLGGVPYDLERRPCGAWVLLAAVSADTLLRASALGLDAQRLAGHDPAHDLTWIHLDGADATRAEGLCGVPVLLAEPGRLLVSLPPAARTDDLGVHGAHGHFRHLSPDPHLLRRAPDAGHAAREATLHVFPQHARIERIADIGQVAWPKLYICPVTPTGYQDILDRYSGAAPLDASGSIVSRHSRHPDNARAVDALVSELRGIGYCAYRHAFVHEGRTLHNVIADLPGTGYWVLKPLIRDRVRDILIDLSLATPVAKLLGALQSIAQDGWFDPAPLAALDALELRRELLRIFQIPRWYPWWRRCALPGPGSGIVIAGCHLDSTAQSSPGFDPTVDAAPGVDDDGSGLAATLALARYFWKLRGKLTHTLRFAFFNAEEQGLVGSHAYAAHLKSCNAPVRAVLCSDMIGYNSDAERIFELHAGATDPAVRDASVPIAQKVLDWAATFGKLGPGQLYKGTSWSGAPDRDVSDGAINRSDHGSFQAQGWPAALVSEDFFANLPGEPASDPNPNYHRSGDTVVDADYAADIVCAMAQALRGLAS